MKKTSHSSLSAFGGSLRVEVVNTAEEAAQWVTKGFTPIECCFGKKSVVDDLQMDHHGDLSHLEGVAVRAYRDHFGERCDKPWFVVTGFPDEDATFAIAALAGLIPHPSLADQLHGAPREMLAFAKKNLIQIAKRINQVDLNPDLAVKLADTHWGRLILAFRQQGHPTNSDSVAWVGGVDRWRNILTAQSGDFVAVAANVVDERLKDVRRARSKEISQHVVVVDFSMFGKNSMYYGQWTCDYPILVAFVGGPERLGSCSFVGRDLATLRPLLGDNGFLPYYLELAPPGCGGREVIGGSSRSRLVNWKEAITYGRSWQKIIDRYQLTMRNS